MFGKASNLHCDINGKIKNSLLTKCYARQPWTGMDSGSEENNLFHHGDLSPCTAKTFADNIQNKIHTNTFVQQNLLAQSASQD